MIHGAIEGLREAFTIEDDDDARDGARWLLRCRAEKCRAAWALQKPAEGETVHGGNVLHLLNHAAEHDENRDWGKKRGGAS